MSDDDMDWQEKASNSIKRNRKDLSNLEEKIKPHIRPVDHDDYGKSLMLEGVITNSYLNKKYLNKVLSEIGWKVVEVDEEETSSTSDSGDAQYL